MSQIPTTPQAFDAQHAAAYDDRWAPLAPLRDSLHLQIGLILHDLPVDARVLCVGAGTGAELVAFAQRFPGWRFVAVDPSAPMLEICRRRASAEGFADRCEFHAGYVQDLPATEAFHAATALLVSQFITDPVARTDFYRAIAERLRPGGHLVTADLCRPTNDTAKEALLEVWKQMMRFTGATEEQVANLLVAYARDVAIITPADLTALLTAAGFNAPTLFSQSLLIHAHFARRSS